MGRIKPAWYYEKKAQEAEARANYYRTRTPPATGTTINSRGASTTLYYRSLLLKAGAEPLIFAVNVDNDTLANVSAAEAGLKTTLGAGEVSLRLRGSGVKPTRIHWMRGDATPTVQRTAWNTKWVKYYQAGAGSHRSVPVSEATGAITPDDIQQRFDELFGPTGSKRGLLGTANGRAYIEFERAPISAST